MRPLLVSPGHDTQATFLRVALLRTLRIGNPAVGLLFFQAPRVYLAFLAKTASADSPAHLGLLVILVSLDYKALQDLKVWQYRH